MIGGSSGVGRALVELLAERQEPVLATARDMRDLETLQRHCAVRFGRHVIVQAADIAAPDFDADAFLKGCADRLGSITHLFLSVGAISAEDCGIPDDEALAYLTMVNYTRPAQLLGAFCRHFEKNGYGHAVVFSSIAAGAPRGNNAAYASAKAALEFYCRALQHYFSRSVVLVHVCRLGYIDTSMTFGLKLRFPIVSPSAAAEYAIRLSETKVRFAYFPSFWSFVTAILKIIPWPVYKRLRF